MNRILIIPSFNKMEEIYNLAQIIKDREKKIEEKALLKLENERRLEKLKFKIYKANLLKYLRSLTVNSKTLKSNLIKMAKDGKYDYSIGIISNYEKNLLYQTTWHFTEKEFDCLMEKYLTKLDKELGIPNVELFYNPYEGRFCVPKLIGSNVFKLYIEIIVNDTEK